MKRPPVGYNGGKITRPSKGTKGSTMPVHDWTRVEAGIFHDFHHSWIEEIKRALNTGLLSDDYYALAEHPAAGFGPDVLTLQGSADDPPDSGLPGSSSRGGNLLLTPPQV